jgi:hypothetical protein
MNLEENQSPKETETPRQPKQLDADIGESKFPEEED